MRKDIHPAFKPITVKCASCGNEFTALSTRDSIVVEICSACHPFWTGKKRMVDTAGRVERFRQRAQKGSQYGNKQLAPKAEPKKKRIRED
jgi:large subunit ribosomal protein L31